MYRHSSLFHDTALQLRPYGTAFRIHRCKLLRGEGYRRGSLSKTSLQLSCVSILFYGRRVGQVEVGDPGLIVGVSNIVLLLECALPSCYSWNAYSHRVTHGMRTGLHMHLSSYILMPDKL